MLKLYEVQKYLTLDGHIYGFGPMGINDKFFSSLSEEKQSVILAAGKKAVQWNRKKSYEQEMAALEIAKANNVSVIEVSPALKRDFARISQPAAIRWLKNNINTPSLIDDVLNEVERLQPQ